MCFFYKILRILNNKYKKVRKKEKRHDKKLTYNVFFERKLRG